MKPRYMGIPITPADPELPVILCDDEPVLREKSAEVTEFGEAIVPLIGTMLAVLDHKQGQGLAAVQIGVLQRVIVAIVKNEALWMINPVIMRQLNRFETSREGCLSVRPQFWREVSRPAKCDIEWQDVDGTKHKRGFSGQWARVLQHEIDHLDGILITDKEAAR